MRWIGLLMLVGCSDSGAHFTLSAPVGPSAAASFRVILATPDQIPSIANQRVTPTALETRTVPYFLQQTVAGADAQPIDHVDGLTVKIEADPSLTSSEFIPFVLLYDAGGAIAGVGTFHAPGQTSPSPVIVRPNEIDKYVLDVEPATQVDDQVRPAAGQVQVVECFDSNQDPFTSGIAWRPAGGGELRVLFPKDGGLDATQRELDLDCDGHPVTAQSSGEDCDDTRAWFNRDAPETCDGYDTNCDGLSNIVVACTAAPGNQICPDASGMGLTLCNDQTGQVGQCQSDPQCLCATNPSACPRCQIDWRTGMTAAGLVPCQPGVGTLATSSTCSDATPCKVQVLSVTGGWRAEVASTLTGATFGLEATGVGASVLLKVKRPEGPGIEIPGTKGESTGEVDLGITAPDGSVHLRAIDLRLSLDGPSDCVGSGPFSMFCYP